MSKWIMHPKWKNYGANREGVIYSVKKGGPLSQFVTKTGYLRVSLYHKYERKSMESHRFIMQCFNGESDLVVNHKDGNKKNNRLENLEYVSQRENVLHAISTGLKSRVATSRINPTKALAIRILVDYGFDNEMIIETINGATKGVVNSVKYGNTWAEYKPVYKK